MWALEVFRARLQCKGYPSNLRRFPPAESGSQLCGGVSAAIFSLLLAGVIAGEKVAGFRFLIYCSLLCGWCWWVFRVIFRLLRIMSCTSTWSGMAWWVRGNKNILNPVCFWVGALWSAELLFLWQTCLPPRSWLFSVRELFLSYPPCLLGRPMVVCSFPLSLRLL